MAIRIFIGTSPNGEDHEIEKIYEYTLRKHTTSNLDITWMRLSGNKHDIWHGWNTKKWFTPFSGLRWAIPFICGFKGKAIYTDVDMINLSDITELYEMDLEGKPFAARKGIRWGHELCVMVIDCEKAKKYIWEIKKLKRKIDSHKYHRDLLSSGNLITSLDSRWNCLDGEDLELDKIFQLHFTNMSTQPWKPSWYLGEFKDHPRKDIIEFYEDLKKEVFDSGFKSSSVPNEGIKFEILL